MASDAPDPSSSELLTDFDIADVDNWDDENDSSKEAELLKAPTNYVNSPTTSHASTLNHNEGNFGLHRDAVDQPVNLTRMDQLKRMTSNFQGAGPAASSSPVIPQQHISGHDYAKNVMPDANAAHTQRPPPMAHNAAAQTTQGHMPSPQSVQALDTLRALAKAQEEQARIIKEEQERALHLQKQAKIAKDIAAGNMPGGSSTVKISTQLVTSASSNQASGAAKMSIPITTLKLPITDPKGKQTGKPNSVLQLKGQLVRTPDQKLMLVTEVAGKKVGYLISPQSGQLQSAAAAIATQLASKPSNGGAQSPIPAMQAASLPAASSSPGNVSQNSISLISKESMKTDSPKTASDSTDFNKQKIDFNRKPSQSTIIENVTLSSDDEDSGALTEVATNLKNIHLQPPVIEEKKKKKGRPRKKKDKNEPPKPLSPYLMFFKDIQPSVREHNPGAGLGEVSKMVSQLWEKATLEDRKVYNERSARAKEEYQIKLAEYRASLATLAAESVAEIPPNPVVIRTESPSVDTSIDDGSNNTSLDDSPPVHSHERIVTPTTSQFLTPNANKQSPIVISDSSPERGKSAAITEDSPEPIAAETQEDIVMREEDSSMDYSDVSLQSPVQAPVRKRGRPKKGTPPLTLPKIKKKNKKKEKIESPLQETPPLKLTMKINIKDSKITESPTKALEELAKKSLKEVAKAAEEEDITEKEVVEPTPSTQPKALQTFKIPLKKQRSTSSIEEKAASDKKVAAVADNRTTKASVTAIRKCARNECEKPAKINRERGPSYCSNQCLVLHCRSVFNSWVAERREASGIET